MMTSSKVSMMVSATPSTSPSSVKDPLSSCDLCPRHCGVNRHEGERGVCGAGDELRVARAALHFWEEPVLSGNDGSGAIFFSSCPLGCVYCQNAEIAQGQWGQTLSVERLAAIMLELQAQQALNINLVTATHWAPQVYEALRIAKAAGLTLPIVWNTSSYETVEAIRAQQGLVDVYLADYKYAQSRLAQEYSRAADYPDVALRALEAMVDSVGAPVYDDLRNQRRMVRGVMVRQLLLPGHCDDVKQALKELWERFGNSVVYSLMSQYTPVLQTAAEGGSERARRILAIHPSLGRGVYPEEYEELLDYADALGIEDYFWQEGEPARESFIPAFDGTGL